MSDSVDKHPDKCAIMFKSEAFMKMPEYPMLVEGILIEFLADI